jgi:hypothetical protein
VNTEPTQPKLPKQPDLAQIGVKFDERGRAHNMLNGRFISYANVGSLALWHDYILENAPDAAPLAVQAASEAQPNRKIIPPWPPVTELEPVTLRQRARRLFHRAKTELYLLPQTSLNAARSGFGKLSSKAEHSRRRNILTPVIGAMLLVGAAGKAYAGAKYGYSGGSSPEKHQLWNELTYQHLGNAAVHGGSSNPGKHELWAELQYSGNNSSGQPETVDSLSNPGRHKLWAELKYHPAQVHGGHNPHAPHLPHVPQGQEHPPGAVFLSRNFVEHGHGITQEYVDVANQHGIRLSGEEAFRAYNYVNAHVHGHFFTDDPTSRMADGNWGISRPGWTSWTPQERFWFHHWLVTNGKVAA